MASDNHASFARIGFTIVVGVVAIVGALVYLGGMRGKGTELLAETYYDKPVSGLSVGSAVNFRGVKVGEVKEISFVGSRYRVEGADRSRICILMSIDRAAVGVADSSEEEASAALRRLVDTLGLRATVTASGITGLSRIECDFFTGDSAVAPPPISWTPRNVYVPAKISLLDGFSVAATKVMNQINKMDLNAAWSNLNASVESLSRAMRAAETMIETRQGDIDRLVENLSATATSVKDLAAELKRNPSLLIRERKPRRLDETE